VIEKVAKKVLFASAEWLGSVHFGYVFEACLCELSCFIDAAGCFASFFILQERLRLSSVREAGLDCS
jgi:hypothetical protein